MGPLQQRGRQSCLGFALRDSAFHLDGGVECGLIAQSGSSPHMFHRYSICVRLGEDLGAMMTVWRFVSFFHDTPTRHHFRSFLFFFLFPPLSLSFSPCILRCGSRGSSDSRILFHISGTCFCASGSYALSVRSDFCIFSRTSRRQSL